MFASHILQGLTGLPIKTIRYGTVTVAAASATGTDTFAAVDTANSILIPQGSSQSAGAAADSFGFIELTNTTTVTVTRNSTTGTMTFGYLLIEFSPGFVKSVTRGQILLTGVATNTAVLALTDVNKSLVFNLGYSNNDTTSSDSARWHCRLTLTSSVLLTATKGTATGNSIVSYQVVEFY